jgi:hypothetical protein
MGSPFNMRSVLAGVCGKIQKSFGWSAPKVTSGCLTFGRVSSRFLLVDIEVFDILVLLKEMAGSVIASEFG